MSVEVEPFLQLIKAALKSCDKGYWGVAGMYMTAYEDTFIWVWEETPGLFENTRGDQALEIRVIDGLIYDVSANQERFDKLASKLTRTLVAGNTLVSPHITINYAF